MYEDVEYKLLFCIINTNDPVLVPEVPTQNVILVEL